MLESDYSFRPDAATVILIYRGTVQWNAVGTFSELVLITYFYIFQWNSSIPVMSNCTTATSSILPINWILNHVCVQFDRSALNIHWRWHKISRVAARYPLAKKYCYVGMRHLNCERNPWHLICPFAAWKPFHLFLLCFPVEPKSMSGTSVDEGRETKVSLHWT